MELCLDCGKLNLGAIIWVEGLNWPFRTDLQNQVIAPKLSSVKCFIPEKRVEKCEKDISTSI